MRGNEQLIISDEEIFEAIRKVGRMHIANKGDFAYLSVDPLRQFYKKTENGYEPVEDHDVPEDFLWDQKIRLGMTGQD